MNEDWILVFSSPELYQAKIAEDVLKQNGIVSHIASQPDSILPQLGEAKLYTVAENAAQAMQILRDNAILVEEADEDDELQ